MNLDDKVRRNKQSTVYSYSISIGPSIRQTRTLPIASRPLSKKNSIPRKRNKKPSPLRATPISVSTKSKIIQKITLITIIAFTSSYVYEASDINSSCKGKLTLLPTKRTPPFVQHSYDSKIYIFLSMCAMIS